MHGIDTSAVDRIIQLALEEDLSHGDITTQILIDPREEGIAKVIAKEEIVLAGREVFERTMNRVDPYISINHRFSDGSEISGGSVIMTVTGPVVSILAAERTALNFLCHLCGVATMTRAFVRAIPEGARAKITDTRKTLPGLRALEKYAVRCGGGINHRSSLGGGILIKDNHIAICGGVAQAVAKAKSNCTPSHRIEIEVSSLEEIDSALSTGAEIIMLDNMQVPEIIEAMKRIAGRAMVEVSGNITVEKVPEIARTGVDFISVGAITHSAMSADISLEIEPGYVHR